MSTEKELLPDRDALDEALPDPLRRMGPPGPAAELLLALSADGKTPPRRLGERLAARVAASRAASSPMLTRRRPRQGNAEQLAEGLRAWPLGEHSRLVEWQAGARLELPAGPQEILLLQGSLRLGSERLDALEHALLAGGQTLIAEGAVLAYLRNHAQGPFEAPVQALQRSATTAWQPLREGVEICPLQAGGGAISLLARFAAGASVPAHEHGVAEECLMVEGELFLGDLLLPEGGFQAAPAGSSHGDLFADAPCMLFFHGAIDAAAIDNAHRAQLGWPAL